jgi:hypothetical protein
MNAIKKKRINDSREREKFHLYDSSSLPLLPQHDQAVSVVGGDVMPSMAYLLLPFKCLVFNLYFIFLCSNNRKRYGTRQYEHTNIYRHK